MAPVMTMPLRFTQQPVLTAFGLLLLALLVPVLIAMQIDPRMLDGVSVWTKPAKFLFSIAVHVLSFAWFMGYVAPERRDTPGMRHAVWILVAANSFELLWIGWQAAHGLPSHFNQDTPFYAAMYALMGIAVLLIIAQNIPLARAIWRYPAAGITRDFAAAVAIGLLLTVLLGGGFGIYMSQQPGHAVGAVGGHLPLFGWNRIGGDLRVAHFLGIHAEQAIPLLALLVVRFNRTTRWIVILTGSISYTALTAALFVQAVMGLPFLPR